MPIKSNLQSIADYYNVKVTFDSDMQDENSGSSAGNEMWLGKFEDKDLLTIAFFHELVHCLYTTILPHNKYCSSILAQEGFCWEYGFELAAQYGFIWDTKHKVYKYAEQNLRSYVWESE